MVGLLVIDKINQSIFDSSVPIKAITFTTLNQTRYIALVRICFIDIQSASPSCTEFIYAFFHTTYEWVMPEINVLNTITISFQRRVMKIEFCFTGP